MGGQSEEGIQVDEKTKAVLQHKGYIVMKKISAGSFGEVYKAKSTKRNEINAVKVMHLERAASKGLNQTFLDREIAALIAIRHPNVLKVNDIFRSGGRLYIFMEFAPNGTLEGKIKKSPNGYLKESQAKHWFKQCVEALHCMQVKHHMCHRDIKAENILMDSEDNCKLSDFGFAREFFPGEGHEGLAHTFCGTAPYYAPEIVMRKAYNPYLYDVWSMGVMLFEMLHGKRPFHIRPSEIKKDKRSRNALLAMMKDKSYDINPQVDAKLSSLAKLLINEMLEFNPNKRLNIIAVRNHLWFKGKVSSSESSDEDDD